jgi:hypothetical protein
LGFVLRRGQRYRQSTCSAIGICLSSIELCAFLVELSAQR